MDIGAPLTVASVKELLAEGLTPLHESMQSMLLSFERLQTSCLEIAEVRMKAQGRDDESAASQGCPCMPDQHVSEKPSVLASEKPAFDPVLHERMDAVFERKSSLDGIHQIARSSGESSPFSRIIHGLNMDVSTEYDDLPNYKKMIFRMDDYASNWQNRTEEPPRVGFLARIESSYMFHTFMSMAIVLNSGFVAWSLD